MLNVTVLCVEHKYKLTFSFTISFSTKCRNKYKLVFLLCKIILFFIYYFQTWADLCTNVRHLTNRINSNSHQQPLVLSYYRNVAKHLWREPQIIKFESYFHIWINIDLWTHTFYNVACHASVHVLQTVAYNLNFIVLFCSASGVLLLVSRIIYLNKCNRSDIIIFRL